MDETGNFDIFQRVIDNLNYIWDILLKSNYSEKNLLEMENVLNHILSRYCFERSILSHHQKKNSSQIVKETFHYRIIQMDKIR